MGEFLDQLLGTWELISYYREAEDGSRHYPLGNQPKGFLLYTHDGYMSAQLMKEGRPDYSLEGLHNGTESEMAQAAHGYHAYAGQYEVDEENQTVYHYNTVSLIPNRIGAVQDRVIKIKGDSIDITSSTSPTHIKWKKAPNLTES